MTRPQLSDGEFTMLVKCLQPDQDTPVRQSAVRILGQAQLNDKQLLTLAKEEIPRAETFLLPGLVDAFEGSESEAVGMALVSSLAVSSDRLDYLPIQDLEKLFKPFPPAVQESAKPLMNSLQTRQSARLSELKKFETSLRRGDVGEGRKLFFGKALCSTCHGILGQGGNFGPDLTNIGEIRSQHDLLEAILYPSASFAREYETAKIVTKATSYTGVVKEQLPETIVVETGPGVSVRVSRNEITAIETQNVSLMPPGLHQQLSTAEMSDLLSYLTSLPDGMGYLKVKAGE
jgi:putative heme-binding domain-containing protein